MNPRSPDRLDLENLFADRTDEDIPEHVHKRLEKTLIDFRDSLRARQSSGSISNRTSRKMRFFKTTMVSGGVGLGVLLAVIVFSTVGNRESLVFAQVTENIRAVRTASYKVVIDWVPLESAPEDLTAQRRVYDVVFQSPNLVQMNFTHTILPSGAERTQIAIMDYDSGRMLQLLEDSKVAIRDEFDPTNSNHDLLPLNYFGRLRQLLAGSEVPIGAREIDGRIAEGFEVQGERWHWTVWADPKTGLPILVEMRGEKYNGQLEVKSRMEDFAFDIPVDSALFSFDIPPGYTEVESTAPKAVPRD